MIIIQGRRKKMNTKEAIEFLQKEFIEGNLDPRKRKGLEEIIALLKTKQEMVSKFSSEVEEQQKNLDQIDLWAMEVQELIKKIRGKI